MKQRTRSVPGGLNGGRTFKHTEAFSLQIATENQEETDRYWNAIVGYGDLRVVNFDNHSLGVGSCLSISSNLSCGMSCSTVGILCKQALGSFVAKLCKLS